jgi:hypothetical protein
MKYMNFYFKKMAVSNLPSLFMNNNFTVIELVFKAFLPTI